MDVTQIFDLWKNMYLFDLFRYLIPASIAFLLFWKLGKTRWNHLFIQKVFPKERQLWREFGYSMSTVVIFSIVGFMIYKAERAGITLIYYDVSDYGFFYLVVSFMLAIIFHDFYFYWTHRLMHHKRIFKYVHKVHHTSTNPSPWAAYSFHPFEAIVQAMVLPLMIFLFPLHTLTIFLFLAYMIVRNVIGHLGFEILPKGFTRNKWLNWNTAITHHNMHHERFNCNYGLYFSWWDRWMNTEDEKYHDVFNEVKSRPKMCELKTRRKGTVTLCILLEVSTIVSGQSVEGKWVTYNEATGAPLSVVEITGTKNSIEGKVSKIFLEPFQGDDPVCTKCPAQWKDQKVLNMNFLWDFARDGSEWTGGKILDPQSGEVYDSKLWLEDNSTLKVRGYGGVMDLFYRTQTWKREGSSQANTPAGIWNTIDDISNKVKSQVEVVEQNGMLFGYVRKIFLLPHEGPDPICLACRGDLKHAKIVGMKILGDFKWTGEKWEDGKILDPGNGNIYTCAIWLVNANELRVRGYFGPFFRSQTWKRLN